MRIKRLTAENIAGLPDLEIAIPNEPLIAIAGANGVGKSKFLSCLLTPWGAGFPEARDPTHPATITVGFEFNDLELDKLEEFDTENWRQGRPPCHIDFVTTNTQYRGVEFGTRGPHYDSIIQGLRNNPFLKTCPSLNVLYLPAERRLHPNNNQSVDLSQLSEDISIQTVASGRTTGFGPGYLDDQEFEGYAKALCVAGFLPSRNGEIHRQAETQWRKFSDSVNTLLYPKKLLSLTAEDPSQLWIELPNGDTHGVGALSSGERQALIIVSRVFRAGEGHSLVAIDEPDAHLHPTLSARLLRAIKSGLDSNGGLIIATHSPFILDTFPKAGIIRLKQDQPPASLESEVDRLDLYRDAGFRASSLTQADLLVLTEGDFDATILPLLMPEFAAASIRPKGGREPTIQALRSLADYDLPIIGIVDSDVLADKIPETLAHVCYEWPASDIEATLISDPEFLHSAASGFLLQPPYDNVKHAQELLTELLLEREEEAVSEYAQRLLRKEMKIVWPSPRGSNALERLREIEKSATILTENAIDKAIDTAQRSWNEQLPTPWKMVRGKWILAKFVAKATHFKSKEPFIVATVARAPQISALKSLRDLIQKLPRLGHQSEP